MATEQTPPSALEPSRPTLHQELVAYAETSAHRLVDSARGTAAEALLLNQESQLRDYTDIATFGLLGGKSNNDSLYEHTIDGIQFGHRVAMGAAVEVMQASRLKPRTSADYYDLAAHVLRNPAFGIVVQQLAVTGFGVIKSSNAPDSMDRNRFGLTAYVGQLNMREQIQPIVLDQRVRHIADMRTIGMSLHPDVVASLRFALRSRNDEVQRRDVRNHEMVVKNHLGKPGFSSGCPVAHGSGTFGLMREYLAQTIELSLLNS